MRFVWDELKNRVNKAKHGVSFETAKLIFDDPLLVSIPDRHEHGEERWSTIGLLWSVTLLVVIHTYAEQNGEEVVRIISARRATSRERKRYEEGR